MQEGGFDTGRVTVRGATLGYAVRGSGEPVLVVGSSAFYRRTFSPRLADSYTMAFADLRHFSPSEPDYDFASLSFDVYAEDIDRVRAALGFERCVVVGHSKHGNIALEYAKRHPGRVTGVVLIGSPPCGLTEVVEARGGYWEAHASAARKAVLARNWASFSEERLAELSPAEAVVVRYVADGPKYWCDPEYDASPLWEDVVVNAAALDRLHEVFRGYEMTWNPDELRCPVLSVMGRHDFVVPHSLWDAARARLPRHTDVLFERSGHTPQLEEPELFERLLISWLKPGGVRVPG